MEEIDSLFEMECIKTFENYSQYHLEHAQNHRDFHFETIVKTNVVR